MPAPPAIIDSLESVFEIFFSGVRHRERAAFILCDNLVEMTCKMRASEHNHQFNLNSTFHQATTAPGLSLNTALLGRVQGYRNERNNLQHGNPAATVDHEHCATAICDAAAVIEHCWPGSIAVGAVQPRIRHALRIATLYSSAGDVAIRPEFENVMGQQTWCVNERELVRSNGRQIEPGKRDFWYIAIRMQSPLVDECLNQLGL
jgi:hypothetical protein